jgi:hypothetical protein
MITDQEKDHEDLVIKEFLVDFSGSCNEWCDRNESKQQDISTRSTITTKG